MDGIKADARLLSSVESWAAARATRLVARRVMESHHCEYEEQGDYDTGGGVPRCYRSHLGTGEWCQSCQTRNPLFDKMMQLKHIEKGYFRALCALVDRRAKAMSAAAVDPADGTATE